MRVALERIRTMVPFLAIFGAALCGYANVGPWVIAVAALGLFAVSRAEYADVYDRAEKAGATAMLNITTLKSIGNALVATAGAYGTGLAVHLL